MSKKITQSEARRLQRRVDELERAEAVRNNAWSSEWPGGVHVYSLAISDALRQTIRTAGQLGHATVVRLASDGNAKFYACKLQNTRVRA